MDTSHPQDPFTGKLNSWAEISGAADWDALVLGNGLSINLWNDFQYQSLFEQAKASRLFTSEDEALFAALGVENFEEVLHKLSDAIVVGEALGEERKRERERHASIQKALAEAVQRVHISGGEVPLETLEVIRNELRCYRHAFTTSYDLILYWAAAKGGYGFDGFYDFFWAGGINAFDESTITLSPSATATRLYFLHGALHLVVLNDEKTCKRKASLRTLLDQFGEPFRGDHSARPLVVTEARASDKRRSVEGNDYLAFCWRTLSELDCPVVVFGHSLSAQDAHLVDALNEHRDRPIAVSIRSGSERKNRREQHRIAAAVEARPIYFFDAATHPLGSKDLRLRDTVWRESIMSKVRRAV